MERERERERTLTATLFRKHMSKPDDRATAMHVKGAHVHVPIYIMCMLYPDYRSLKNRSRILLGTLRGAQLLLAPIFQHFSGPI